MNKMPSRGVATPARRFLALLGLFLAAAAVAGCKSGDAPRGSATAPVVSASPKAPAQMPDEDTAPPDKTGGFDGKRAFADVAKQVDFGPHPSGSQSIAQVQDYILAELSSAGCTADIDPFTSQTPAGDVPMKNILVKIPGDRPGIIMLATHYDSKKTTTWSEPTTAAPAQPSCSKAPATSAPSTGAIKFGSPSSTAKKPSISNG